MKYNVQLCLDTSPNAVPGISVGLFNTEVEAKAAVQALDQMCRYMRIPTHGNNNPVAWYEEEREE